jgi:hypothetical protein
MKPRVSESVSAQHRAHRNSGQPVRDRQLPGFRFAQTHPAPVRGQVVAHDPEIVQRHMRADGQGHPVWSLTFMLDGQKHVERIPPDWVDSVRQRVEQARMFKEAIAEIFAANAQLLALQRDQSRVDAKTRKARK